MSENNERPDGRRLKKLMKEAVEASAPDLRRSMAPPRRAKVTAVKPAGGTYVCSVQAVKADGRPDAAAPVIPDVEIPVFWAGPDRGLTCPPTVGEFCDLGFYDGDPNSPFIMAFRPNGKAPAAELNGLTVQHSSDILFGFRPDGTFFVKAPKVEVEAAERATIKAPLIELKGHVKIYGPITTAAGAEGVGAEMEGDLRVSGKVTDGGGNTNHHSH